MKKQQTPISFENYKLTWKRQGKRGRPQNKSYIYTGTQTEEDRQKGITVEMKAMDFFRIKRQIIESESGNISSDFNIIAVRTKNKRGAITPSKTVNIKKQAMRQYVYELDGEIPQDWDTRTGKCVFDYLIYRFKNENGFKKGMNYSDLNNIFKSDFVAEEENPLISGVSIEQLKKFCDYYKTRMYAYDEDCKEIECYTPTKVIRNKIPLIFRLFNNHFYPIEDKDERYRLSHQGNGTNNTFSKKSLMFVKKKRPTYNIIAPESELDLEGRNNFILSHIYKRNTLPYPIKPANISFSAGSFNYIILENDYIMSSPICEISKKMFKTLYNEEYQGENITSLLYRIWSDIYTYDIQRHSLQSTYNVAVYDALHADSVKYRTHLGMTDEEHLKYLEVLPKRLSEVSEKLVKKADYTKALSCKKPLEREKKVIGEMDKYIIKKAGFIESEKVAKYCINVIIDNIFSEYKNPLTDDVLEEPLNAEVLKNPLKAEYRVIDELLDNGGAVSYDIEKCYSSLILNPMDTWIRFDFESELEPYKEQGKAELLRGLYFCETYDLTVLHQSNWYSNKIVDYAKSEGIDFKITYQIIDKTGDTFKEKYTENGKEKTKTMLKSDYFKRYIDKVLSLKIEDKEIERDVKKSLINLLTGILGKTQKHIAKVGVHNELESIWEKIQTQVNTPLCEISLRELSFSEEEDKKLWIYGLNNSYELYENSLPMYIQILDWSNILLHRMIKEVGGKCIYRKTDCIVAIGGNKLIIPERKGETDGWGKARYEKIDMVKRFNFTKIRNGDRHIKKPEFIAWKTYDEFKDSDQWEDIIKILIKDGGGLIEGRAGVGKTHIIKQAIKEGIIENDATCRWCFTNKASRNLDGITIHSALSINIITGESSPSKLNYYKTKKHIIIDEIGMINKALWKQIQLVKKLCGCIFILLGDYRQLPPIEIEEITDDMGYFNHPTVKYLANNNRCDLTVRKRYDELLWNFAELVCSGQVLEIPNYKNIYSEEDIINVRNICFTNNSRHRINNTCMAYKIKTMAYKYLPYIGNYNKQAYNAYIYEGLPIMATSTNSKLNIMNSDEFIVNSYDDNNMNITEVRFDDTIGGTLDIALSDFHKLFVVNYCATTHKSQGLTIKNQPLLIWENHIMDKKLVYTAITRATLYENVFRPRCVKFLPVSCNWTLGNGETIDMEPDECEDDDEDEYNEIESDIEDEY